MCPRLYDTPLDWQPSQRHSGQDSKVERQYTAGLSRVSCTSQQPISLALRNKYSHEQSGEEMGAGGSKGQAQAAASQRRAAALSSRTAGSNNQLYTT